MKVNLAAQTLSSSVADALEKNGFTDCEATIDFIRRIDHLFDLMNSRNPIANNYEAPMRATTNIYGSRF